MDFCWNDPLYGDEIVKNLCLLADVATAIEEHYHNSQPWTSYNPSIAENTRSHPIGGNLALRNVADDLLALNPVTVGVPDPSWKEKRAPDWLLGLVRGMDGSKPKLIFERKLFKTDVLQQQGRLSMPISQVIDEDFLTAAEREIIEADVEVASKTGIGAILVDKEGGKTGVMFKRWESKSSWSYCLTCGWYYFVNKNNIKAGQEIRLWSFRWRQVLCFAIVTPSTE